MMLRSIRLDPCGAVSRARLLWLPRERQGANTDQPIAWPVLSPAVWVLIALIRTYQWTLRPFIGANCRFYPTCSEYAVEALRAQGALRGAGLAAWRILRCNPWNRGGYDPVPACQCRLPKTRRGLTCSGETGT